MNLRELLSELPRATASGPTDVEILGLADSSRTVQPGMLFAAIRGTHADGHRFIDDAIEAGAVAVVAETAPPRDCKVSWLHVPDSRAALAVLATVWNERPANDLALIGVTGTNGKTTTAFVLHHVLKRTWHRAGLLGTIRVDDGEAVSPAQQTTPGTLELTSLLSTMRNHGCRAAVMEVSSHGIHQKRIASQAFDVGIFTNLTQDHLDYHGTLAAYYEVKADWFRTLASSPLGKKPVAVINVDDPHGSQLAEELDGQMKVVRFGFGLKADFRAIDFRQNPRGLEFKLEAKGKSWLVRAPYIGRFNVYNVLAAIAAADAVGIRPREAVAALADAPQVPGRMENIGNSGGTTVFVDYAHTPDALENACKTLKELNPRRLITVFGCGGDRDRTKRPLMAAAASRYSDICVLTSDNPRSEDPEAILREIAKGMTIKSFHLVVDRAEAIQAAIEASLAGDIVLIAGKGHETFQQFADHTIEFEDRKHASKALRDRAAAVTEMRAEPRKTPPPHFG